MSALGQEILFSFLGGLGLFLFSIKYMGDGLQLIAGDKMRYVLDKYTSKPLMALLAGIIVTILIQSSTGTIVITVSLVGAGLLKTKQAIAIVMGSNIGTTLTSFIIGFNVSQYSLPLIFLGAAFLFFTRAKLINNIGRVIFGFGGIFYSLKMMSTAMGPLKSMEWFQTILTHIDDSAWVGVGVGTLLTVLIQSSAATIAIVQNLYAEHALNLHGAIPVIFGDNIGTAITTAALAIVGTNIAAKRVAISHVMFNIIGTIICLILLQPYISFVELVEAKLGLEPKMAIAFGHGTFNIFNTILQFPFIWLLVKIITKIIPGEDEQIKYSTQYLDKSLITSAPAVALGQVEKEFVEMLTLSKKSLKNSVEYFMTREERFNEKAEVLEDAINTFDEEMTNYLTLLFREKLSPKEGMAASILLDGTRDIERIGDHARDIVASVNYQIKKKVKFSDDAKAEVQEIYDLSNGIIEKTIQSLEENNIAIAGAALAACENIYELEKKARKKHTQRMKDGECEISAGVVYMDLIQHFTRICEHARNILEKEIQGNL